MTLRVEIFPSDLAATADFYVRVLGFTLVTDRRESDRYCAFRRGNVIIGAAERPAAAPTMEARRPPVGVELVLEVDDLIEEHDRVLHTGWPLEEGLNARPWGLTDFRLLDPSGYYVRITHRPG